MFDLLVDLVLVRELQLMTFAKVRQVPDHVTASIVITALNQLNCKDLDYCKLIL